MPSDVGVRVIVFSPYLLSGQCTLLGRPQVGRHLSLPSAKRVGIGPSSELRAASQVGVVIKPTPVTAAQRSFVHPLDFPARSEVRFCSWPLSSDLLQTVRSIIATPHRTITKHRTLGSGMAKTLYSRIRGSPPAATSRNFSDEFCYSYRRVGRP